MSPVCVDVSSCAPILVATWNASVSLYTTRTESLPLTESIKTTESASPRMYPKSPSTSWSPPSCSPLMEPLVVELFKLRYSTVPSKTPVLSPVSTASNL